MTDVTIISPLWRPYHVVYLVHRASTDKNVTYGGETLMAESEDAARAIVEADLKAQYPNHVAIYVSVSAFSEYEIGLIVDYDRHRVKTPKTA